MEKVKKSLIKILIILLFIILILGTCSVAAIDTNIEISNKYMNDFVEPGNKIFGIVKVIGILCSVIGLMIIGLRYMMGSIEEKADYKKTLPYYLLGMVLIAGIVPLAELVYKLVQEVL